MFRELIHTEIDIRAGAPQVWRVLTELESYPEWNPMIRRQAVIRPFEEMSRALKERAERSPES